MLSGTNLRAPAAASLTPHSLSNKRGISERVSPWWFRRIGWESGSQTRQATDRHAHSRSPSSFDNNWYMKGEYQHQYPHTHKAYAHQPDYSRDYYASTLTFPKRGNVFPFTISCILSSPSASSTDGIPVGWIRSLTRCLLFFAFPICCPRGV